MRPAKEPTEMRTRPKPRLSLLKLVLYRPSVERLPLSREPAKLQLPEVVHGEPSTKSKVVLPLVPIRSKSFVDLVKTNPAE
jgi:hypothetical protein